MGRAGAPFRTNPLAAGSAAMTFGSLAPVFGQRCIPIDWPLWSTKQAFDVPWRTAAGGLRAQPVDATPSILIDDESEAYDLTGTSLSDDPRLHRHE